MTSREPPAAASGPLLLADIGGYTAFLQAVASAHRDDAPTNGAVPEAYAMMSSLLDGIIERVVPPFSLSKLEGDAVFAYATDEDVVPHGAAMLEMFAACQAEFRGRVASAHEIWTCPCGTCARVDGLALKFILHAGPFVIQQIAGREELSGPEVVMAHRLLKTGAADLVGHGSYALITAAAAGRYAIPTERTIQIEETFEHYPPISGHVVALQAT